MVPSFRKERQWSQQLTAQNPVSTPNIDKEKIQKILNQPKKPVKFTTSYKPADLDPLDLKRLPTRPALFNPEAKKVKLSVQAPKMTKMAPTQAHNNKAIPHTTMSNTVPPSGTSCEPGQFNPPPATPGPSSASPTGTANTGVKNFYPPAATPGPSSAAPTGTVQSQAKPSMKPIEEYFTKKPVQHPKSATPRQATLDMFVKKLKPNNIFKPALTAASQGLTKIDGLFQRLGHVEEDLALSESSDSDSDLEEASKELEKEVLRM